MILIIEFTTFDNIKDHVLINVNSIDEAHSYAIDLINQNVYSEFETVSFTPEWFENNYNGVAILYTM